MRSLIPFGPPRTDGRAFISSASSSSSSSRTAEWVAEKVGGKEEESGGDEPETDEWGESREEVEAVGK